MRRLMLFAGVLAIAGPFVVPVSGAMPASAATGPRLVRTCAALAAVSWPDGSRVTSAAEVRETPAAPRFCSVTVLVPDRINLLVGLPENSWNGRYEALGGGGYNGTFNATDFAQPGLSPTDALKRGFAISMTDTGHQGDFATGEWGWTPTGPNWTLIQDFAYRANHEMAVKAKALIADYYGSGPKYSYWNGCSSGGREGLTEATRYPSDFDGIAAGDPAINWTRFVPAEMWPPMVMKMLGHYLPECKEAAVAKVVARACAGSADRAKDGLIDPRACRFNARRLLGVKTPCGPFNKADVAVIDKIWQGPRDAKGRFLWYGLEPGADLSVPGLGLAGTVSAPAGNNPALPQGFLPTVPVDTAVDAIPFTISNDWMKYFVRENPAWDWHTETYAQYIVDFQTSVKKYASVLATDNPDLHAFRARGGRLIIYHGLADELIFPQGTINYYKRVIKKMGGLAQTTAFARLFLMPNVAHCSPSTGPYPDDPLGAVMRWREHHVAPASLPATGVDKQGATFTRNLCPEPQRMLYTGKGSVRNASSFRCAPLGR